MQGIFRYVLASLVVLGHLWKGLWDFPIAHPGMYAVFSFYLLSGYLMALTLSRTYAYTLRGTARFFGNRALRIFPPYLFVLAGSVLLLRFTDLGTLHVSPFLKLPHSLEGWLKNLFIFGLGPPFFGGPPERPSLVPPAWSLDVELCFYVAMALLLGRGRRVALVWLLASVGYTAHAVATEIPWQFRYTPAAAASLPFSLGAVLYHWRDSLARRLEAAAARAAKALGLSEDRVRAGHALAAGALFLLHALVAGSLWDDPVTGGFYLSLALSAWLLLCLNALRIPALPPRLVAFDRFLGKLSYPVFLCHSIVASVVARIAFEGRPPGGGALFWSALLFVNLAAWGVHALVERPVERLRDAIRPAAPSAPKAGS